MGDILEIITTRRTIKEFIPKFVSWENISRVLDAGRHAPSSGNIQNWRFITVFVPGEKQQLAEACYGQYEVAQAWVLIVICGEPERAIRYYGEKGKHYTVQNCAAAAENMLLEAHSLGLGGRWIGAFDEEAVKSLLGVPPEATVEVIVAVGYPKEIPGKPPKYPLEPIAYFSRWRLRLRDPHKYMNNLAIIMGRRREAAKAALKHVVGSLFSKVEKEIDTNEQIPTFEQTTSESSTPEHKAHPRHEPKIDDKHDSQKKKENHDH